MEVEERLEAGVEDEQEEEGEQEELFLESVFERDREEAEGVDVASLREEVDETVEEEEKEARLSTENDEGVDEAIEEEEEEARLKEVDETFEEGAAS